MSSTTRLWGIDTRPWWRRLPFFWKKKIIPYPKIGTHFTLEGDRYKVVDICYSQHKITAIKIGDRDGKKADN